MMQNYADRGVCYPSRPRAKVDNRLRDRHSILHIILKLTIIYIFICSKHFLSLNKRYHLVTFFRSLARFSARFQDRNRDVVFFLKINPSKSRQHPYSNVFWYSCINSVRFQSRKNLRIAENAIFQFSFAQAAPFPGNHIIDRSNSIPNILSKRWYILLAFSKQLVSTSLFNEELAVGLSKSETGKYFE